MSVIAPVRVIFRSAAIAILPSAENLDDDGWREMERIVDSVLARQPRGVQRQFRLFLRILDLSTLVAFRARFHRLDSTARHTALERLARGPRLLMRRGVWGLRTLVYMGYYTQPARAAAVGYQATSQGWFAHGAGKEPAAPAEDTTEPADTTEGRGLPAQAGRRDRRRGRKR